MSELLPHQKKIAEKRYFQLDEKSWENMVEDRVFPTVMIDELREEADLQKLKAVEGHLFSDENSTRLNDLGVLLAQSQELLNQRKFLFNTPTWINAGMPGARTLSACFVGELKDKMLGPGGILDCSTWFGTVQKFGGGTGIDLSALRPKGTSIKSTHGKACGPLMVLKYLAATSQMITQGGARDGANMAVMSVYHEDIEEFIRSKAIESKYLLELPLEIAQQKVDSGEWTHEAGQLYIDYCKKMGVFQLFNMSVAVDDKFMKAVQRYVGRQPQDVDGTGEWTEELPCGLMIAEVWDLIVEQSHASGDPGLLFIETAQRFAIFHSPYIPSATNPCGEQWLPEHGSCNLGSIDLAKFVPYKDGDDWEASVDWYGLHRTIVLAVRMLDNVVSVNKHPVDKIAQVNHDERRIGLGIMGWADVLFKLKIPYDSKLALEVAEHFANYFKETAHQASVDLAVERGPFPLWEKVRAECQRKDSSMPSKPRRNATVTTVAPTGTISLMAGCSSGIEPHFMLGYEHKGLAEHGGLGYIWASDTLRSQGETFHSSLVSSQAQWVDEFEQEVRKSHGWKPANEVSIDYHVYHQSIWQKHIDNSISKTLNLANNSTVWQVAQTFLLSYSQGCKGSTVYRDGCKPFQPLNAPKVQQEPGVSPEPAKSFSHPLEQDVEPAQYVKNQTRGDWVKGPADKVDDLEWQAKELKRLSDEVEINQHSVGDISDVVLQSLGTRMTPIITNDTQDNNWNPIAYFQGLADEQGISLEELYKRMEVNQHSVSDIKPIAPTQTVMPGERIKKKRDKIVHGVTIKEVTSDGSLYVTINRGIRDEPFEVFARVGKAGGKAAAYTEAIGRLISMALQYNIPIEDIKKELRGIKDGDPVGFGPNRVLSVPDGVGKAIEEFLEYEQGEADGADEIESAPVAPTQEITLVDACPECGAALFKEEGCSGGKCIYCGYAKCQ